jgi:hypothetical protein
MLIKFLVDMDIKPSFIHQISNQQYYVEIYLYDQINNAWAVPMIAIDELCIEETLSNWTTTGYIVLNNPFEILERGTLAIRTTDGSLLNYNPNPIIFRGDGRNKLSVRIYPLDENFSSEPYPKEKWEMCYDFAIFDVEDIQTGNNQKKLKKLNFWDERYQIFSERNIDYSTVYSSNNVSTEKLAANPNVALKDIIKTAGSNPPVMKLVENSKKIKIGFNQDGDIANPTEDITLIDDENWDLGQQNQDLVIYTSPSKSNAIYDIKYMLDLCVAKDGGPVFLDLGRTSDDKKWKLQSISTLFKNSQNDQIEHLTILDSLVTGKPYEPRAFAGTSEDNTINFEGAYASKITSYSYTPRVAADDARITNSPVHFYNFNDGTFNIEFQKNSATVIKDNLEKYGKEGLYSYKNGKGQIKIILNQTKQKGIQIDNIFTPHTYFPKNYGAVKKIKDALMLNETIHFQTLGLTIRTPGKFMFIDSPTASDGDKNVFHEKFYGQWLITKVKHIFTQNSYHTDMVGVKVDSYQNILPVNDTKN